MNRKSQSFEPKTPGFLPRGTYYPALLMMVTLLSWTSSAYARGLSQFQRNIHAVVTGPVGTIALIVMGIAGFGLAWTGDSGNPERRLYGIIFLILAVCFFMYRVLIISGAAESFGNRYN